MGLFDVFKKKSLDVQIEDNGEFDPSAFSFGVSLYNDDERFNPRRLKNILKALTIIDIIMVPEENDWARVVNGDMHGVPGFTISDGIGNDAHIFFNDDRAVIRGFYHESDLSPYNLKNPKPFLDTIYRNIPGDLFGYIKDVSDDVTFCMWCDRSGTWYENAHVSEDGGKANLFDYITDNAEEWISFAQDYYFEEEHTFDADAVDEVFKGAEITPELVLRINPYRNAEEAIEEILSYGF